MDPTRPLKWVTRLKLAVHRSNEPAPFNGGQSVEICRDDNTGQLLYIREAGHLAAVAKR